MAGVIELFPYIWRVHWRALRTRGAWRTLNVLFLVVVGMMMLPFHVSGCVMAAAALRRGDVEVGTLLTELLLSLVFAGWIFLPVLVQGMQAKGEGITPAGLLRHPFSMFQLTVVSVTSALMQPVYWILIAASIAVLIPLTAANPYLGLPSGILFIALAALLSWALGLFGQALFTSRRPREIAFVLLVACLGALYFLFVASDFRFENGSIYFSGFGGDWLLVNRSGTEGVFVEVKNWTPGTWARRATFGPAQGLWLGLLAAGGVLSLRLCVWSLRRTLLQPVTGATAKSPGRTLRGVPGLSPAVGAASAKEILYFVRNLEPYMFFFLSLAGSGYLALSRDPPAWIGWLGVPVLTILASTTIQNSFGLDRGAVDRYRLLPMSGADVLLSKNAAFLVILGAVMLPAVVTTAVRFDAITALRGLVLAAVITSISMTFGNLTSVRYPWPRHFFAFNSNRDRHVIANLAYSSTLVVLIGAGSLLGRLGIAVTLTVQTALLAGCLFVYRNGLKATGRMFDTSAQSMRQRLSD